MACKRCSICGYNIAVSAPDKVCPACDSELETVFNDNPDEDWEREQKIRRFERFYADRQETGREADRG